MESIPEDINAKFKKSPHLLNDPSFQPQIMKNVPPPRISQIKRSKFNSTATIFMNRNILTPDVDETLNCLSVALYWMIKTTEKVASPILPDIFSEEKYPLGDNKVSYKKSPEISEIYEFLYLIYHGEQFTAETAVMTLAYIERLIALTGITLHASNWRRVVLGATVIASKVFEDMAVWNSDFLEVFPKLKMPDLANLEREFLIALQFTVTLSPSVYAKYYFELRSIADRNEKNFPLQPLSEDRAKEIEAKSRGVEATVRKNNLIRTSSMDPWQFKSKVIGLEDVQNLKAKIDSVL